MLSVLPKHFSVSCYQETFVSNIILKGIIFVYVACLLDLSKYSTKCSAVEPSHRWFRVNFSRVNSYKFEFFLYSSKKLKVRTLRYIDGQGPQ